jgi:hypothetical protein
MGKQESKILTCKSGQGRLFTYMHLQGRRHPVSSDVPGRPIPDRGSEIPSATVPIDFSNTRTGLQAAEVLVFSNLHINIHLAFDF